MGDTLLIYNPAAGRISVRPFIGGVIRTLNDQGYRVEVAESVNGRHTTQLAHMAAQENFHSVFAIGGDGTAGQAAAGLIGSQTALGILPAGTTNVWARELGMHPFTWSHIRALNQNARLLANMPPTPIDVGLCNGLPFLMWAGVGLDAMTVKTLGPRKRFEKYLSITEFAATTIWNATIWHGMDLHVIVDEKQIEGHYLLALVSNIRHYAVVEISPSATIDDGWMDLWLLTGSTLADAFRHMFDMLAGQHVSSENARCVPFRKAVIESATAFPLQMDGEPMLGTHRVSIEVVHRGLKALLPAQARNLVCSEQV